MSLSINHTTNRITQDGVGYWKDNLGPIILPATGVTVPTWTQMQNNFYGYAFQLADRCWFSFHIGHDYLPGSDIYFHTHWTTNGTSTNSVKWEVNYTIAKGHNQSAFSGTGTTITIEQAASGTAWRHMISESAAITSAEIEPDSLMLVHLTRITNGATDNGDTVFLHQADLHFQASYLGTKNKSPNFYS